MKQKGFSLLELITVLLIICILLTLSIPTGRHFLAKNRAASTINTLLSALYTARSEAIQRGEKISFCKSNDEKNCSGDWSDGQIITNASGEVLQVLPKLPSQDKLVWLGSFGKNESLDWLPTGYTDGQRGSFYYCAHDNVAASRVIVVLNTGRLYTAEMDSADHARVCGR
ncbi:MAG: fimT [Gammaproteobacteria bacterium]|jgi:type IV fimbrial biogenesis protein FimT|nr:fimT [Gammaproteobacteria bacterium]